MSGDTGKVCCNCKHCIREWDADGHCDLHCEIDGHYIGYVECHEGWCKHWSKVPKWMWTKAEEAMLEIEDE